MLAVPKSLHKHGPERTEALEVPVAPGEVLSFTCQSKTKVFSFLSGKYLEVGIKGLHGKCLLIL